MEDFKRILEEISKTHIIASIIIVIISIVIYKLITFFLNKGEEKSQLKSTNSKKRTYLKLLRNILRYVFSIVTVLIVLQINGIDVSSILAGVGIAGVIFGLAIQDWLKDVIRGSRIL